MKNVTPKADVIILSCKKYKNGNQSYGHKSTSWTQIKTNFQNNLLFIFYGNENQNSLFEYKAREKILSIKTSDEYDNIAIKTWLAYFFWLNYIPNRKPHLITFGDDSYMESSDKFISANFKNIDYGGVKINGPKFTNTWHQKKVHKQSYMYNKLSPRPNNNTKWVHEGTGVVFSEKTIKLLLKPYNFSDQRDIKKFSKFVRKTCWYNDVLLSHLLYDLNIKPTRIQYFGIKGDR